MKIIHSAWTTPMVKQRWNVTDLLEKSLWLYGYSIDYATTIGLEIDMYTDSRGAEIFNCLPYRNIYTNLDELDENGINERFWSAGKIIALRDSEIGSVHIDGDVFLKKPEIIPMLEFKDNGAICQMQERIHFFVQSYQDLLPMFLNAGIKVEGFDYSLTTSLNAGVLGFSDLKLKDKFIDGYFDLIGQCQSNQEFMSLLKYDLNKRIEPNIIIEQFFLRGLCEHEKVGIKYLLETNSDDYEQDMIEVQKQAESLGFVHAYGGSKFQIIEAIKDILRERNPELCQAIAEKVIEINNI